MANESVISTRVDKSYLNIILRYMLVICWFMAGISQGAGGNVVGAVLAITCILGLRLFILSDEIEELKDKRSQLQSEYIRNLETLIQESHNGK